MGKPISRRKQEQILRAIFEQKVPFNRLLGLKVAGSLNSCSSCGSNKTSCGSGSCN